MAVQAYVKAPKPYAVGSDFSLWVKRFESYAKAVKVADEQISDALLSLLDDSAFRAFDLLGLTEEQVRDYKQLVGALKKRFAPTTGEAELRFQFGQRCQKPSESFDEFVDAIVDLVNRAYPEMEAGTRMNLVRDRFIAGVRADFIQERLLQQAPVSLDEARRIAKELYAARAARKRMQTSATEIYNLSTSSDQEEIKPSGVAVISTNVELQHAVQRNTEILEQLGRQIKLLQTNRPMVPVRYSAKQVRCWICGKLGHIKRNCTARMTGGSNSISEGAVYVSGIINDKETKILVDTGSAVTIVNKSFLELPKETELNQSVSTPVVVANGQPLSILGVMPVSISIAGIKYNHEAMITNDITHDCLLGTDFLIPHACTIDLKQHRLLIGNKSTELITTEQAMQSKKKVCHISLSSTTVIRDREEKLLWAEVRHPEGEQVSYPGVVEPREEVLSKHPIMVARVLAIPGEDKLIPIRITNLTVLPITLYKGQTIGNFCPFLHYSEKSQEFFYQEVCSVETTKINVDHPPKQPTLKELKIPVEGLTIDQIEKLKNLIRDFPTIFSQGKHDLGRTNLTYHYIDTGSAAPIKQMPRRLPLHKKQVVGKLISEMQVKG